jgi:cysteinyl-tRNA synthetase
MQSTRYLLTTLALATGIHAYAQEPRSREEIINESWQVIRDEDPQEIRTTYPTLCIGKNREQHNWECSSIEQMFIEMHNIAQDHYDNFAQPYCTTSDTDEIKTAFRRNFCRQLNEMASLKEIGTYLQEIQVKDKVNPDLLRQFENTIAACGNVYAHFAARTSDEEKAMVAVIYEEDL